MTSTHPVAFFLKELSGEPGRRNGRLTALVDGASDLDAHVAEAHARGILEARAAAQVEQDVAFARQQAVFEQKLAAERQRWSADEGKALAMLLHGAITDLEQRVADAVSHILKPVVVDLVRAKAVDELKGALERLIARGEFAKITISAPRDLLAAIEAHVDVGRAGVTFVEADSPDVSVRADNAILETRIADWIRAVEGGSP